LSNTTLWLAFSLTSAQDIDGDGLSNQQEISLGTDYQNPDTDGNGLPDGWEYQYFGSPTGTVASADADGDGMSNLAEFTAGTVPTNSSSLLRILSITPQPNGNNVIVWTSTGGKNYQVYATTNMTGVGFAAISGIIPSAGSTTSYTDSGVTDATKYYKVKVAP
jgi:hypothetical protein